MLIMINTDNNISGNQELESNFRADLENMFNRFSERITRLEVHLGDENSHKEGRNDKRCMIEARLNGLQPIAVTHKAESLDQAVAGAAEKMKRSIENTLGRLESS